MLIAALLLASCGDPNSEVIRHLVIAELIQSERVPESQVEIVSIAYPDKNSASVQANILDLATKGSTPSERISCRLERREGRWRVTGVSR